MINCSPFSINATFKMSALVIPASVFIRGYNEPSIIFRTDSYKIGHRKMLPHKGKTYAYFEARNGAKYANTTFFGLQYYLCLLKRLTVTRADIDDAEQLFNQHLTQGVFDRAVWDYIVDKHDGNLPIEIYAVDEGSVIPQGNVLMVVSNTDDECYWLPAYLETFLEHLWYPCTVATISRHCKDIMREFVSTTCDNAACLPNMLYDFGARGVNSDEGASVGGAAHTIHFQGTDTVISVKFIMTYYLSPVCSHYPVYGTEHSVMTKKGREGEHEVINELIASYPTGILSLVIDSYNMYATLDYLGTTLKETVLKRDGKLVVRPDSGDPAIVSLTIIKKLDEYFGSTVNTKGYKIINPKVGMLYGDGISPAMIQTILSNFEKNGYAASNIVFGMGGGLLQKCDRDTQRFAYKVSAFRPRADYMAHYTGIIQADGLVHIYKDPIDKEGGSKRSKSGILILVCDENGKHKTINGELNDPRNLLKRRFYNGVLENITTYKSIKDLSAEIEHVGSISDNPDKECAGAGVSASVA